MSEAPGFFDSLFSPAFQTWLRDFRQAAKEHSSSLTTEGYIRLIIIVGAYCMIRPYLVKLGGRFQASDHDRELDETGEMNSPAAVSPNALRGRPDDGFDDSSSEEEEAGGGVESAAPRWGRSARRRQRRLAAQRVLEVEEKAKAKAKLDEEERGQDADSDREIEEFLRKVIN